jgi:hypothetical protein
LGENILLLAADAEAGGPSLFEGYLGRKAVSSSTPRAEETLVGQQGEEGRRYTQGQWICQGTYTTGRE